MTQVVSEDVKALLTAEPLIAHLATCHDERPHAAPIWFNYRDEKIEIVTTGQKLVDIRQNPRVAISIQKDENGDAQWGISIRGTATVVEDEHTGEEMLRRINRRYGAPEDAWSENTPVQIEIGSVNYWEY